MFDGGSWRWTPTAAGGPGSGLRGGPVVTRWGRGQDDAGPRRGRDRAAGDGARGDYRAMVPGLARLRRQEPFPGVVLGLSGGIDSALSAAVAVDALGPERVHAVMMPSRYTSRDSLDDAEAVAAALGIRLDRVPIEPAVEASPHMLAADVRRPPARHHRGEHPVAHPRRDADGALEQARAHGADHRQQVRDVGRLRHALRRHVRRLLGAEGRLQDDRVRARPLAQPKTCRRARGARVGE